jgi:hypothetical protein
MYLSGECYPFPIYKDDVLDPPREKLLLLVCSSGVQVLCGAGGTNLTNLAQICTHHNTAPLSSDAVVTLLILFLLELDIKYRPT